VDEILDKSKDIAGDAIETTIRLERDQLVDLWTCDGRMMAKLKKAGIEPERVAKTAGGKVRSAWYKISPKQLLVRIYTVEQVRKRSEAGRRHVMARNRTAAGHLQANRGIVAGPQNASQNQNQANA